MSNLPHQSAPRLATDEDLLVYAAGDYLTLCPAYQQMAAGNDGVIASASPWVLTSASCNFVSSGVVPNQVVWLTAPKAIFPGGGHALAIDSVSGNTITLRRPYKDNGVGQPPAGVANVSAVSFNIVSFDPQIAEASYDIKQRYGIQDDPTPINVIRSSSWIYDMQALRQATVFWVLYERYCQEARADRGDFKDKVPRFRQKLDDALARVQVRWGQPGSGGITQEPSTLFSCRVSR